MSNQNDIGFARLIWERRLWDANAQLTTTDGSIVTVIDTGELSAKTGNSTGVVLNIAGAIHSGEVTFDDSKVISTNQEILQVSTQATMRLCAPDGNLLPQLILPIDSRIVSLYRELLRGVGSCGCGEFIAQMESCHRLELITRLLLERLERKYNDLMKIHSQAEDNWNHTLYVMLFATMGSPYSKVPFAKLAQVVPYSAVTHEKGSLEMVEAMLLGGSGLLQVIEDQHDYIRRMRGNFNHMQAKYAIKPMHRSEWGVIRSAYPNGKATLRIMQLAGFLTTKEFVFDNLIKCRSLDDVRRLFYAEASPYWGFLADDSQKIGFHKRESLGINLVVPMMFAYGQKTGNEELSTTAYELLEKIPVETNAIVSKWSKSGVQMSSAFDSQAIIQLNNEYCKNKRCAECPFGKAQISAKFNQINSFSK